MRRHAVLLSTVAMAVAATTAACGSTESPTLLMNSGDAIAFAPAGTDAVAVMAPDGDLLDVEPPATDPAPWPNRDRIIRNACGAAAELPLRLVTPDGVVVGPPADHWLPAMSPDGTQAVVACFVDVDQLVLVDGDAVQEGSGPDGGNEVREDWSRTGRAEGSDRVGLRLASTDGTKIQELSNDEAADWLPRWSPDGRQIAFETNRNGNSDIFLMDVDQWPPKQLTDHVGDDRDPAWSRDGHFVAFTSDRSGDRQVWLAPTVGEPSPTGRSGLPVPWGR